MSKYDDMSTEEIIKQVAETHGLIAELSAVTPAKLIEWFGDMFRMDKSGNLIVRRSPNYAQTKLLWVKHPLQGMIIDNLLRLKIAAMKGEDCRVIFIKEGAVIETSKDVTDYLDENGLIPEILSKGWLLTTR